jgi:hypothetical protein
MRVNKGLYFRLVTLIFFSLSIGGCLLSGTFVVNLQMDEMIFATSNFYQQNLDLTTNQTYNEHKDQIKDITDVGFALKIENNSNLTAGGELYITDDGNLTTPAEVKNNATVVLTGVSVEPNSTKSINWSESYQYVRNLDVIKEQVKSGSFWVYALVDHAPLNLRIYDASVIVSFAAVP